MRRSFVLVVFAAAAVVHCSTFESSDVGGDAGAGEGGSQDGGGPDTGDLGDGGVRPDGAGVDASQTNDICTGRVRFPGDAGCIDPTEITTADYTKFAEAVGAGPIDAGAPWCPSVIIDKPGPTNPGTVMAGVSFCQAKAYCEHVGMSLCGKFTGASFTYDIATSSEAMWFNACTGGTNDAIHLLDDAGCQLEAGSLRPVGQGCVGGYPGLFDMVGNASELVYELHSNPLSDGGVKWGSAIMGGSYTSASDTDCKHITLVAVDTKLSYVGFRCCSP